MKTKLVKYEGGIESEDVLFREMTKKERNGVRRLERVLQETPNDLELATSGNRSLGVWSIKARREVEGDWKALMHDGGAISHGVELCAVNSKCLIHGVSG